MPLSRIKNVTLLYLQIRLISFFRFLTRITIQTRAKFILLLQTLFIGLFALLITGRAFRPNIEYTHLVKRSGLFFNNSQRDVFELSRSWSKSFSLWNEGNYFLATKKRIAILEEIYSRNGVAKNYYPPILSDQFFGVIGHHAFTGIHIAAQDLGLIPQGRRVGVVDPKLENNQFVSMYKSKIDFVNYSEGRGWTELPIHWHLTERMQVVRGNNEFIECFDLVDRVFIENTVSPSNPLLTLEEQYVFDSRKSLRTFGLKEQDWFVGLHIRNGGKTPELRNQDILNYIPAIKEITKRGGWVIRIGNEQMPPLPKMERVVDLVVERDAAINLHLFVLAFGKFFIGTHSGPQFFPPLFGVPTIFTNHIGIGRNALTFSKNSFTIPKSALKRDGSRASFMEILQSPFGYGELTLKEFEKRGLRIQENSAEELENGVLEMFTRLSGQKLPSQNNLDNRISDIRRQLPWASKGNISNSYMILHEDWFLA